MQVPPLIISGCRGEKGERSHSYIVRVKPPVRVIVVLGVDSQQSQAAMIYIYIYIPPLSSKLTSPYNLPSPGRILNVCHYKYPSNPFVYRHVACMEHRFRYRQRLGSLGRSAGRTVFGLCLHSIAESSYVYVARRQLHFSL